MNAVSKKVVQRLPILPMLAVFVTGFVSPVAQGQVTTATRPSNSRPQAADDQASVHAGATLTVAAPGVLGNDTDADQNALTARQVSEGPANGTLRMQPDGSFTYKPNGGFMGADAFTYVAYDGLIESEPATVKIVVRPNARHNHRR